MSTCVKHTRATPLEYESARETITTSEEKGVEVLHETVITTNEKRPDQKSGRKANCNMHTHANIENKAHSQHNCATQTTEPHYEMCITHRLGWRQYTFSPEYDGNNLQHVHKQTSQQYWTNTSYTSTQQHEHTSTKERAMLRYGEDAYGVLQSGKKRPVRPTLLVNCMTDVSQDGKPRGIISQDVKLSGNHPQEANTCGQVSQDFQKLCGLIPQGSTCGIVSQDKKLSRKNPQGRPWGKQQVSQDFYKLCGLGSKGLERLRDLVSQDEKLGGGVFPDLVNLANTYMTSIMSYLKVHYQQLLVIYSMPMAIPPDVKPRETKQLITKQTTKQNTCAPSKGSIEHMICKHTHDMYAANTPAVILSRGGEICMGDTPETASLHALGKHKPQAAQA
jgi:hypothetical protein